jgi:superfamily II DNA or RNA helicase
MPKAVISSRIFMDDPGIEHTKKIIKSLTYKITKDIGSKKFAAVETIKNFKVLTKGIISIPQGRTDLIPEGYEIVDKRILNPVPFPTPKFALREDQQEIYDQIDDTCFVNALVGWGKTFTALHLARKFGQKTIVITHTAALRDQWIEEVESLFGMRPGVIGGGIYDIEDHAIVVGNIQSIVKYLPELSKEFGFVILDEAHHCPASTFAATIDSFHARYRLALSGTMIRKDGKHIIFRDYFGDHILKPAQANTLAPVIHIVKSGLTLKPGVPWVDKITDLCSSESYQQFIAGITSMEIDNGHSVLVVADRVEFLQKVKEYVGDDCLLVTGSTEFEDRKRAKEQILSGEKWAIAGSRQIFAEGISINRLSCLILAVPMSNDSLLEQLIGRIQRLHAEKLNPLVIDINFAGYADKKQNNDRLGLYMRKGWQVITN